MSTRVIVDTNIIIALEENKLVDETVSSLLALLQSNNVQVLIHPASFLDIERDNDLERRQIKLSKLKRYTQLSSPPDLDRELFENSNVHIGGENDEVDCTILTALARNAVHFLITNDRRLHGKARKLALGNRVFTALQAYESFSAAFAKFSVSLPNLEKVHLHEISAELDSSIFDSLREGYLEFNDWFNRIAREGREAWIARDNEGKLGAICIYKVEEDAQVTSKCKLNGKALKLCTLKVGVNIRGQKMGELILKAAFRHATKNKIQNIYITAKKHHTELIEMLDEFGFHDVGEEAKNNDTVFVKSHPTEPPQSEITPVEYHINYAPHYKAGSEIRKFLIPIKPDYHAVLFPDYGDSHQMTLPIFPQNTAGNALKLAYLCKSKIKKMRPGDIAIFYRSQDSMACTTIGIIESVDRMADPDIILEKVIKRTVYTRNEIEEICKDGCLVTLFRLQAHFVQPVGMKDLESIGIKGPLQSIREISDEEFKKIAEHGKLENCLFSD